MHACTHTTQELTSAFFWDGKFILAQGSYLAESENKKQTQTKKHIVW